MQVVITSGHPHAGYQLVHRALEAGGVQAAYQSRREGLTPHALTDGILRAHHTDRHLIEVLDQMSPGKVWQDLAVDLFLGNLSQENWGWADANTIWLLDFWLSFDPQTRFVLVYCSPAFSMASMTVQSEATADSISLAIRSWTRWNVELLRFSVRNPERCLLVNSAAVARCPGAVVISANESFGLHLSEPSGDLPIAGIPSALTSFLTDQLLDDFHEAVSLYDELESAAHLAGGHAVSRSAAVRHAWSEHLSSVSNLQQLHAEVGQLTERCHRAEEDFQSAAQGRQDSGTQLEALRVRIEEFQQSAASAGEQGLQLLLRNTELTQENQLLFLQLKQLQSALEQTSSAHVESERQRLDLACRSTAVTEPADPKHPRGYLAEVAVDMRQEIDGKNWYWAEHDGRWAGPGTHGTLRLPPMGPGRYEVNLDVVDAMDPEILADMQVTLCGIPLMLEREGESYPAILKGVAVVDDIGAGGDWDLDFQFPNLASPAQRGSTDNRQLAIRLRSLRLRALHDERLSSTN